MYSHPHAESPKKRKWGAAGEYKGPCTTASAALAWLGSNDADVKMTMAPRPVEPIST